MIVCAVRGDGDQEGPQVGSGGPGKITGAFQGLWGVCELLEGDNGVLGKKYGGDLWIQGAVGAVGLCELLGRLWVQS